MNVDVTCILTRRELKLVLADLERRANRSVNAELNLIIVRLACCCGLRASEIGALHIGDVRTDGPRPHVYVAATAAKGHKPRRVPLWWDRGTLADLSQWKDHRLRQNANSDDAFLCSVNQ